MKSRAQKVFLTLILILLLTLLGCSKEQAVDLDTVDGFGSIQFEKQPLTETLLYDPNGGEQVLKLTDKNGATWTLIMPPGALLETTEISMSSLSNIKSDRLGKIPTGVELKPDGLAFLIPVQLRVNKSGLSSKDILITSNTQGEDLQFLEMTDDSLLQASLFHFSNQYALPRTSTLDKILLKIAELNIQDAIANAENLLKEPLTLPEPPRIRLPEKCSEDEHAQTSLSEDIGRYTEEFKKPEITMVRELVLAMKAYVQIAGKNMDADFVEVKKLVSRIHEKCNKVIEAYQPEDEYYLPVSVAVITTQKEIAYFTEGHEASQFFEAISAWGLQIIDEYLDQIRNDHLYSKAYPIVWLGKQVSLLGSDVVSQDFGSNLFYQLSRVLNFRVEFINQFTGPEMEFITEGNVKNISVDVADSVGLFRGEGKGQYRKAVIEEEGVTLEQPNPFNVHAMLFQFAPCHSETFSILINAFGPESDIYYAQGYPQPATGVVHSTTGILFQENLVTDPAFLTLLHETMLYEFELALQDGNETAGELQLNRSIGDIGIEYTLRLIHTPLKTSN